MTGNCFSGKQRAVWNTQLEKSLFEILHEYKDSGCRGDNSWNSEGWNRMVKEFHARNKFVSFTKSQTQEKEGQLKGDYKTLKAARQQSGPTWNEKRYMVDRSSIAWDNLQVVSCFVINIFFCMWFVICLMPYNSLWLSFACTVIPKDQEVSK